MTSDDGNCSAFLSRLQFESEGRIKKKQYFAAHKLKYTNSRNFKFIVICYYFFQTLLAL